MTITASDLWTRARTRIGLGFTDGRLDDNNIDGVNALINAGLMDMSADHDWDWLYAEGTISVVAGTETYATPTNYMRTLWIANDTNEQLFLRQRRDSIKYAGASAYPRYFHVANSLIYLSPIPTKTATYRHGYFTHIPEVDETSIANLANVDIEIPALFVPLAGLFIAKHICMSFKDYDTYKMIDSEIMALKKRLDDNSRRSLGPVAPQTRQDY